MTRPDILFRLICFLLAGLATIVGFNLGFPGRGTGVPSPIKKHLQYVEACRTEGQPIDLIIIGSSLAIAGIDTMELQKLVRRGGHAGFNALTVAATSFDLQGNNRLLREVLRAEPPGLRILMMEQSIVPAFFPNPHQERTTPYLWLFADPRETVASIDGILRSKATSSEKLGRVRLVIAHFFAGLLDFNFVGAFTRNQNKAELVQEGAFALKSPMARSRGHVRASGHSDRFTEQRWNDHFEYFKKTSEEGRDRGQAESYSPSVIHYPFQAAKARGVDLIVLFTPSARVTNHTELYEELSKRYRAEGLRTEVWDYNDLNNPDSLRFMKYELRWDEIHLGEGVELFTREIADRLIHFLDEEVSTNGPHPVKGQASSN